jgi:hypothetical protein
VRQLEDGDMNTNRTVAITKSGITKIAAPPALNLEEVQSEHKIEDQEILDLLDLPLKADKKKKKATKKKE